MDYDGWHPVIVDHLMVSVKVDAQGRRREPDLFDNAELRPDVVEWLNVDQNRSKDAQFDWIAKREGNGPLLCHACVFFLSKADAARFQAAWPCRDDVVALG